MAGNKPLPPIDQIKKVVTHPLPSWPTVGEDVVEQVVRVLRTESLSQLGKGDQSTTRFEQAWARYCGVNHCLSCNGGTSALAMAIGAVAGPGDEVILPTYTWNATAIAVIRANAVPVFADIDPLTLTISAESVRKLITPRTRAILVVHIYGHPADMDPIMAIAAEHGLVVIEDAAQAHGATYKGRKAGSLGHVGCFSHQGSKNLFAGEGGTLVTNDQKLFRQCVVVGAHPIRQTLELPPDDPELPYVGEFCENYRMHPLAAAVLEAGLPKLDGLNAHRRRNAAALYERIGGIPGIEPGHISPDVEHGCHILPFYYRSDQLDGTPRDVWLEVVKAKGVPMYCYVATPLHLRRRVREHRYYGKGCPWECPLADRVVSQKEGDCPVAERHCAEAELTLGFARFCEQNDPLLDQIAEAIRQASEEAPLYARQGMRGKTPAGSYTPGMPRYFGPPTDGIKK